MAYTRLKAVDFGTSKTGLTTVGYRLLNADGTVNTARTTAGVVEAPAGSGSYQAAVTFPDGFSGKLTWDTGEATPKYAHEDINASQPLDLSQAVPTSNTAQTLGDALNAARAQGFGKWVLSGTTLTLYAADGTTVVRTFTLNDPTSPTQRV
ncbi:MAG TPA: hypothetical protein VFB38_19505 [Chthonomonadaceae bacterium]|jgi:hypothetical protein|nr:hypothetical protein [Chthonomonadaceae bacterium]